MPIRDGGHCCVDLPNNVLRDDISIKTRSRDSDPSVVIRLFKAVVYASKFYSATPLSKDENLVNEFADGSR